MLLNCLESAGWYTFTLDTDTVVLHSSFAFTCIITHWSGIMPLLFCSVGGKKTMQCGSIDQYLCVDIAFECLLRRCCPILPEVPWLYALALPLTVVIWQFKQPDLLDTYWTLSFTIVVNNGVQCTPFNQCTAACLVLNANDRLLYININNKILL